MTDSTPRFTLPLLQPGQAQKEQFHNEAVIGIDTLLHLAVASIATNIPPDAPVVGDAWIVGSAPSGAWTGKAGAIASWTTGGWRFLSPRAGMAAWLMDAGRWGWHDGYAWHDGALPSAGLRVGGLPVVGTRQPAIPSPSGGTSIDTEARVAISSLLDALREHGLIST